MVGPGELLVVLERARGLGFLGPGAVEGHVEHARGFLDALAGVQGLVIDLGSGGGVPGLVVAVERPDLRLVLVDAMGKRCRFLEESVTALGLDVEVIEARAEELGRGPLRGTATAVLARGFGPPATTAECAAPLLGIGGLLVVSEPPGASERWPVEDLSQLGMAPRYRTDGPPAMQILEQTSSCPDGFPRRNGIPAKRPLF